MRRSSLFGGQGHLKVIRTSAVNHTALQVDGNYLQWRHIAELFDGLGEFCWCIGIGHGETTLAIEVRVASHYINWGISYISGLALSCPKEIYLVLPQTFPGLSSCSFRCSQHPEAPTCLRYGPCLVIVSTSVHYWPFSMSYNLHRLCSTPEYFSLRLACCI